MSTFSFISEKLLDPLWKKLVEIKSQRESQIREITDSFGDSELLARYYVPPLCQHHNPADYNEAEAISFVKSPVFTTIYRFLNGEFQKNNGCQQMFVLGDAGMGKTSFLVMLKLSHLTSFWPPDHACELLKLGPATLKKIEAVKD